MILVGKNKDFKAVFSAEHQHYILYYKGKAFTKNLFKYRDVEPYLN